MGRYVSSTVRDGIATVTLAAPGEKTNVLTRSFLQDLEATARRLAGEGVRAAVVVSAKEGGFIAGADIGEIEQITDPETATALASEGQRIISLWAELPFPVIAAVHGHCMGGGTEFALACHYRLAAKDAALSLPEIRLGIFPGFGGTQHLPRLISLATALDIILSGRKVHAAEAFSIGLVDRVTEPEMLAIEAEALARQAADDPRELLAARRRKQRGNWKTFLLERNPLGRALLFRQVRRQILEKTGGHYPAPLQALEVVKKGVTLPLPEALALEASALGPVLTGPVCKNLIRVFHLSQRPKKRVGEGTAPLRRAAVLGAGIMGSGIAQLLATAKIPVLIKDIRPEVVEAGLDLARQAFRRLARKRGEDAGWTDARMALITGTTEYDDLAEVDLVVEAVVEKMAVKQTVLREIEPLLLSEAVFASNTSALSITELQKAAARPERVGGLHFFNPVHRMPLVEVIRGEKTAESTVDFLFAQAIHLGKIPVLAADRPGFLVNRLLMVFLNEACLLAEEGVDRFSLDRTAAGFGLPMGPFRLLDEVGIDIAVEVGTILCRAFSYLPENPLLGRAAESGLRGKKDGRGFYLYPNRKAVRPNRDADARLGLKGGRPAGEEDLRRMLFLMVNEAGRCLQEEVVREPADVDTGMIFGTGFPPFRGGLCRWADQQGLDRIIPVLESLAAARGPRFQPCRFLRERPAFYSPAR